MAILFLKDRRRADSAIVLISCRLRTEYGLPPSRRGRGVPETDPTSAPLRSHSASKLGWKGPRSLPHAHEAGGRGGGTYSAPTGSSSHVRGGGHSGLLPQRRLKTSDLPGRPSPPHVPGAGPQRGLGGQRRAGEQGLRATLPASASSRSKAALGLRGDELGGHAAGTPRPGGDWPGLLPMRSVPPRCWASLPAGAPSRSDVQ